MFLYSSFTSNLVMTSLILDSFNCFWRYTIRDIWGVKTILKILRLMWIVEQNNVSTSFRPLWVLQWVHTHKAFTTEPGTLKTLQMWYFICSKYLISLSFHVTIVIITTGRDVLGVNGQRQSWGQNLVLFCWLEVHEAEITSFACTFGLCCLMGRHGLHRQGEPWWASSINIAAWPFLSSRLSHLLIICHLSAHNNLKVTCWNSVHHVTPTFPESYLLPLLPLLFFQPCARWRWGVVSLLQPAKGSQTFLHEEGSPLSFPLWFLDQALLRGLLWSYFLYITKPRHLLDFLNCMFNIFLI